MQKLKIALLTKEFSANGGVGMYLLRLCPALAAVGHQVFVIHADSNAQLPFESVARQFRVDNFDEFINESESRSCTAKVMNILAAVKPDMVHIHGNNNFLLEVKIREHFPAVKTLHVYDYCPAGNKFHHATQQPCNHATSLMCVARMVYKQCSMSKRPSVLLKLYRRAAAANRNNTCYPKLIVASQYVKQQAVATGYPESQIEVVPCFTDLHALEPYVDCRRTIFFAGRVVREKGLMELVLALSRIHAPWKLIVAGDGPDLLRVKETVRQLRVEDRIDFMGWCDNGQHLRFYREASVVVLPSVWPEPFGLVGIEAMSYAKPVVAFNVGGIPDWLEDGVTGFMVSPGDIQGMADRISLLLENPDVARAMGEAGRKKVEREFVADSHVEKLLAIYRALMDARTVNISSRSQHLSEVDLTIRHTFPQ
jgi:glycosyltransferase involved in cell wall biosynthesis